MSTIKVICEINDYSEPSKPQIKIYSHWNQSELVELEVDGQKYIISGGELIKATQKAMNTRC